MSQYKSCIFFLADGARADIFEENLKAGSMPHISRYIVEKGSYQRGTTVFPSTTGPAYLPFLTGKYPGSCNVPGIRWFDRQEYARTPFSLRRFRSYVGFGSALINRDVSPGIQTFFEIADRPVNIFSSINRGSGFFGNRTKLSRFAYFYYAHLTDRWAFVDQSATRKLVQALDRNPDFVFVVLPAIDEYSHLSDPFGPYTRKAYEEMDRLIGEVVAHLQSQGRLEETLLVLSSDHGLSSTKRHFGVDRFLEDHGMKTFFYPLIYKRNCSAATMVSGNGMCHVYLRGNKSWQERTTFEDASQLSWNVPQALSEREEVDFVAGKNEAGDIMVLSKKGKATVHRSNGHFQYRNLQGDPLGLAAISGKNLTSRESFDLTFASDYPDALVQLEQIFQSPRSGDFIVSARPGCDLRDRFESPEHRASHGSLHREHMHVPIAISSKIIAGPLRTVDLFPTMLHCLGKECSHVMDGINRRESR